MRDERIRTMIESRRAFWKDATLRLGCVALATRHRAASGHEVKPSVHYRIGLGADAPLGGAPVFPADNPWNQDVSRHPVDPNSARLIHGIGERIHLHPDFGSDPGGDPYGIPYVIVPGNQARVPVRFDYDDESDPGPYPIPPDPPIEGGPDSGGDRHILIIDRDHWVLYELWSAYPQADGTWHAGSGAIFDLKTDQSRPEGWASADAAGLPVFPGLVRYDEVFARGVINHALRFTVEQTRRAYVHPARHFASDATDAYLPPMGMRVRLKAVYPIAPFPPAVRVILAALKKYGMFVADNGSNWFISGTYDPRWDDQVLSTIKYVPGGAFEVVKMGEIHAG